MGGAARLLIFTSNIYICILFNVLLLTCVNSYGSCMHACLSLLILISPCYDKRLGWFGPQDPAPLDVAFFPTPPDGYEGVKAHLRKSSAEAVYSMGEEWPRGADGAVLKTAYGAMDRK